MQNVDIQIKNPRTIKKAIQYRLLKYFSATNITNKVHPTKKLAKGTMGVNTISNKFHPFNHKAHSMPLQEMIKNIKENKKRWSSLFSTAYSMSTVAVNPAIKA